MDSGNSSWKLEEQLSTHLRKALSSDGLAPKQKHVRWCSIYTWDCSNGSSFWNALKAYPVNGQDQVALKALILLHKVIREGHPSVLEEASSHLEWLKSLSNVSLYNNKGYVVIIKGYTNFLVFKLQCHSLHPEFDSSFGYKEYIALKRVENPNEGFEITSDLIPLLEKIDSLQKLIFTSFRQGSSNEINISALAPLVEESYAIYQFLLSFLTAMHKTVADPVQALLPLRTKFNSVHTAMHHFYKNSKTIRYLVSIVTIPELPKSPPVFVDVSSDDNQKPSRSASESTPPKPSSSAAPTPICPEISDLIEYEKRLHDEISLELEKQHRPHVELSMITEQTQYRTMQQDPSAQQMYLSVPAPPQPPQYASRQQPQPDYQSLLAYIRSLILHIQTLKDRFDLLQNDLYSSKFQSNELQLNLDRMNTLLSEKDRKIASLEDSLISKENEKFEIVKTSQENSKLAESKYNSLAAIYSRLRTEHINSLETCKELKQMNDKLIQSNSQEIESLRGGIAARNEIIANLKNSEHLVRDQFSKISTELQMKASQEANTANSINCLQKQLEDLNLSYSTSEQRHNMETTSLYEKLKNTQDELSRKESEINSLITREKDVVSNILAQSNESRKRFTNGLIEIIFEQICSSIDKLAYTVFDKEPGSSQSTPDGVIFCAEVLLDVMQNFTDVTSKLFSYQSDLQYLDCQHLISVVLFIPKSLEDLFLKIKFFEETYYPSGDERISNSMHSIVSSLKTQISSSAPSKYDAPNVISSANASTKAINDLKDLILSMGGHELTREVNDVAGELQNFGEGIERSSNRMKQVIDDLKKITLPDNIDPSIFDKVLVVLSAATELAKSSISAQKDIEQNDESSGVEKEILYKTSSIWKQGLISAARSISDACFTVVEDADGLIKGTRTKEQLLVAAHEISAGAAHLLTAARVRSYPGQESHTQLEVACTSLRRAVLILVRTAMEAPSETRKESKKNSIFDDINESAQDNQEPLSDQKLKRIEMEQKVKIIELEKQLSDSRYKLGEILKMSYAKTP